MKVTVAFSTGSSYYDDGRGIVIDGGREVYEVTDKATAKDLLTAGKTVGQGMGIAFYEIEGERYSYPELINRLLDDGYIDDVLLKFI